MPPDLDSVRKELVQLLADPRKRLAGGAAKLGHRWHPYAVTDPLDGTPFSPNGAWEFCRDLLQRDHPLEAIELKQPKGAWGYVMRIDLRDDNPQLYIKLQIHGQTVIGRSFHYDDPR